MRYRDDVYLAIVLLGGILSTYYALFVSPAEEEMGELVRILYFHVPVSLICYLTLSLSALAGALYLAKKGLKYDAVSSSAALLGMVYGAMTLLTGSIWANVTWGVYWNWDPRETTTLILWLAYAGYFLLRMSVANPEQRASVAAVYNVLAFLTVPLSYLSFILWPSLHPRLSSGGGIGLTAPMIGALVLNASTAVLLYLWFLKATYSVGYRSSTVTQTIQEEGSRAA